jgi:hypothetical protein
MRILVKGTPGMTSARLTFGAAPVMFKAEPLFTSIAQPHTLGAAGEPVWQLLTPDGDISGENPWDACHVLIEQSVGVAGDADLQFAEPDLEQQWIAAPDAALGIALVQSCDELNEQSQDFPRIVERPYWFRDDGHSQFDAAVAALGGPDVAAQIRIAHLDTGYDPGHRSLPQRLRKDLARNFVEDGNPQDASDQSNGLLTNLGHGTGTLSILAGAAQPGEPLLGGAPFAEIVPLRVANRVALFKNSAIARAFDHVHGLNGDLTTRIDIITMSMGGLASQAWAEAVNALYEQGVFIVTAAGNNFGNLPSRNIVFPARFGRVVAACGVMANGRPYADLDLRLMAGNYGPDIKMATAIAACTPNVPWARLGCSNVVDFDGAGTSAATPQVAAAAALWLQKNRSAVDAFPSPWMRVEAIRAALFESAAENPNERKRLGRGELRANAALMKRPAAANTLRQTAPDSASFEFLRILTGLGMEAAPSPRQKMLELEALQLSQSAIVESVMPDDLATAKPERLKDVAEALVAHPKASKALRQALGAVVGRGQVGVTVPAGGNAVERLHLDHARNPKVRQPAYRPLRVYAYDPSLGARLETLGINEAILDVRWEENLEPGPIGEYIEIIDVDPASQCCYAPVDLNNAHLLTQSGHAPSEANPQFHQQMTYAVAMKTIDHFERALGRVALWAPREVRNDKGNVIAQKFVRRLRIYPHALRAKNAYYSPDRKALLLGYFTASATRAGTALPGGVICTGTSHDIIAHETTHALLDGLHRRFREPTNPDVFAFHEAFADIVALFQHFTLPEALRHQIGVTRGDLEKQNLLGQLAAQFGQATGRYGALRDYLGKVVKVPMDPAEVMSEYDDDNTDGKEAENDLKPRMKEIWVRRKPKQADYTDARDAKEPHNLGAVLVAAVFDAFLQIYKRRTADLLRLATGGSGILPEGDISADLVDRLAREASKVAGHVLNICIRALDYCPPVDLNFGEYLRALITADSDLVPNDKYGYRTAFIEAFRNRGIYPWDVKNLSPGSLVWEAPPFPLPTNKVRQILNDMSTDWDLNVERETAYNASRENGSKFWRWLMNKDNDKDGVVDDEIAALGLVRIEQPREHAIGDQTGELRTIEVHSVRPVRRVGPDGNIRSDLVVEITQTFRPDNIPGGRFRGGCTLLIDLATAEVRYLLRKKVNSVERLESQLGFAAEAADELHANYFSGEGRRAEPFALMHHVHG